MRIKRFLSLVVSFAMMFVFTFSVNAATYVGGATVNGVTTRTPTAISYNDLARFEIIATNASNKTAKILNATKVNGSNTTWAMRICYDHYENAADYIVNVIPYSIDTNSGKVLSLPFNSIEEGTKLYGKSWFYFVVYDNADKSICGYAIAERLRRFPSIKDKTFSGKTKRNIEYSGVYPEEMSYTFIKDHIGQ